MLICLDSDYEDTEWTNDDVKAFFASSSSETPGSDGDDSSPGSDNSDNNDASNGGNDEDKDKGVPVAAIAGGVVGGAVGVAIVAFLFWFCRRRRRKQEATPKENQYAVQGHFDPSKSSQTQASEMFTPPPHQPPAGGWYSQPPVYPMQGGMQPVEAADAHKAELQGTSYVHEMDGSSAAPRQN